MNADETALSIIAKWANGAYHHGSVQKKAALQSAIVEALKEERQAATLAERDKASSIAEAHAHSGRSCCRNRADEIKDAIRKGEGV